MLSEQVSAMNLLLPLTPCAAEAMFLFSLDQEDLQRHNTKINLKSKLELPLGWFLKYSKEVQD